MVANVIEHIDLLHVKLVRCLVGEKKRDQILVLSIYLHTRICLGHISGH